MHILLRVIVYFSVSKRQDLIDIFKPIRVATQRKVCQRDTESGDVHDRQVWSSLQNISCVLNNLGDTYLDKFDYLLPENFEKLDIFRNSSEFLRGFFLLHLFRSRGR